MATTPTVQYWNGSAWTDISTKVRSYTYTSGRQDEISGASAGQATFVLDNADSSVVAVSVNLLPKMTPIRVMVNGNTQARWTGWVDGSPVTFRDPEGTSSLVTVTAHDSLALLQRHTCQTSIYEETLAYAVQTGTASGALLPAGCGYWPLSDAAGSTSAYEATGAGQWGAAGFSGTATTFGIAGVNTAQTSAMTSVGNSSGGSYYYGQPGIAYASGAGTLTNGITAAVWFKGLGDPGYPITVTDGNGANRLRLALGASSLNVYPSDGAGHQVNALITTTTASDGNWHYLHADVDNSGNYRVYLDGSLASSGAVTGWAPTNSVPGNVQLGVLSGSPICHAWVALGRNSTAATSIYSAASLTLQNLTTTALLSYLAKWALPLAPFGANAIDTQNNGTPTPSAGVKFAGNDCLSLAQVAVDTEDGPLYCARSGVIANLTHDTLTDKATGAATAAFVNGDPEADLTPARDAQYVVTNCQITALSGSGGVVVATNNLAKFGNYPYQKSLYVTDYQAADYANWKTYRYGDIDYSRVGHFTIDLLNSVDIQTAGLAIDIGSRVTLSGLPAQGGFTTADVIVQGFTESWTIDGWTISFNTTPSANYLCWVMEDATYGLLDQTTVLGY